MTRTGGLMGGSSTSWWMTEQGIRDHYHEQREEEMLRHREATMRINREELAALEGWEKNFKGKQS